MALLLRPFSKISHAKLAQLILLRGLLDLYVVPPTIPDLGHASLINTQALIDALTVFPGRGGTIST